MTERIVAAELRPLVTFDHEQRRVVRVNYGVACLPVGKDPEDWRAWVTGRFALIERDVRNNCWIVELEART